MKRTALGLALAAYLAIASLGSPCAAAAAAPSSPTSRALDGRSLPDGFPPSLRQFVDGTPQFTSASWTTACAPHGASSVPNTDPRFGWRNEAAVPGGIDVGRYLEALTPHLPMLSWWSQGEDERVAWWRKLYATGLYGDYPGNTVAATRSPPANLLPRWPSQISVNQVQYHWGFCSAELSKWAVPAATELGFAWSPELDAVTVADIQRRGVAVSAAEKTPCDKNIDGGVWCSIAYYVDCTKAQTAAETNACVGWNAGIGVEIDEDHNWGPQHRSNWQKLESFLTGLTLGAAGVGVDVAELFVGVYEAVEKIIDFISDAASAFDKLVNELKTNAIGLVTSVLQNYNRASAWDPGAGGFLGRYAVMAGLGVILAAFMFLGAIRRAIDSGSREESRNLWIRLLKTLAMIIWAPALFQLLATNATSATADIVQRWTGGEAGGAARKLTGIKSVTSSIPGGAVMGFVLFLFLFVGALGLWVGLMVQRYGMEVGATLIAFVAGAYVHPRWQSRVSRAVWVVVGLILAKPLTMIVLGATFGVINEGLSVNGSPTQVLSGLTLATIGVVTTGLAPFAAMRWAPLLPTSERSHDPHRGGGGLVSGAVLGAAGASLSGRSHAALRAGRRGSRPLSIAGTERSTTGGSGPLASAYRGGSPGRSSRGPQLTSRQLPRATRTSSARRVGGQGVGLLAAGATVAAQSGLVRGRALADHQIPEADLPDEENRR